MEIKGGNILLLAGIGVALLLTSKTTAETNYNALKYKIDGVDIDAHRIRIDILIFNPTNHSLNFNALIGDLFINKIKLCVIELGAKKTVEKQGKNVISIIGKPDLTQIARLIPTMKGSNGDVTISFVGTANVNNTVIPLTFTQTRNINASTHV